MEMTREHIIKKLAERLVGTAEKCAPAETPKPAAVDLLERGGVALPAGPEPAAADSSPRPSGIQTLDELAAAPSSSRTLQMLHCQSLRSC